MTLDQPLTFNEGVFLVPVAELAPEVRAQLPGDEEGAFALTRPQGRNGSKILDADSAELIRRFREPRTLVEAVILYSRAQGTEPTEVLDEAVPLVRGLVGAGYLVAHRDGAPPPAGGGPLAARWQSGDELLGGRVERVLQVLDDTELYLVRRPGRDSVVKIARRTDDLGAAALAAQLAHEAAVLEALAGPPAPRLFGRGEVDGRAWLEIEHVAGVDLVTETTALRALGGPAARTRLLHLAAAVAGAYARLHARGVLHGDVHPRNLLVERGGTVRLIDFGLARPLDGTTVPGAAATPMRGGVPFFYEPELAAAYLHELPPPPASPAGEQYALAALLYLVLAGAHLRDYSLGRDEMLDEIATLPPLGFGERGVEPWPPVEAVLARALAKAPAERYPSVAALAAALEAAAGAGAETTAAAPALDAGPPREATDDSLAAAGLGGVWLDAAALPAPSASVTYGAAGLSFALAAVARARRAGPPLALADLWLERARRAIGQDDGFYEPSMELDRATLGEASPYHAESGIHLVAALVARARGDLAALPSAVAAYLAAAARPAHGLDLTLGRAAGLVGAALLLDAVPDALAEEVAALRRFGDGELARLWQALDREPAIPEAGVDYLGVAHGWAGFLYATLQWCAVAGAPVPAAVERRAAELAALAVPDGRGLVWPWTLGGEGRRASMPGWCNGSAGYVFLWTAAHRRSGDPRHLDLAAGAAWDAWDAPDPAASLCCGLAGRAYALLALWRRTGDAAWLERARALAVRAERHSKEQPELAHSLYKGRLGVALLAAELERPDEARMPLFEPIGYRAAAG